jgi:hypothetical protein
MKHANCGAVARPLPKVRLSRPTTDKRARVKDIDLMFSAAHPDRRYYLRLATSHELQVFSLGPAPRLSPDRSLVALVRMLEDGRRALLYFSLPIDQVADICAKFTDECGAQLYRGHRITARGRVDFFWPAVEERFFALPAIPQAHLSASDAATPGARPPPNEFFKRDWFDLSDHPEEAAAFRERARQGANWEWNWSKRKTDFAGREDTDSYFEAYCIPSDGRVPPHDHEELAPRGVAQALQVVAHDADWWDPPAVDAPEPTEYEIYFATHLDDVEEVSGSWAMADCETTDNAEVKE